MPVLNSQAVVQLGLCLLFACLWLISICSKHLPTWRPASPRPGFYQTGKTTGVPCDVVLPDGSPACLGGEPCVMQRVGLPGPTICNGLQDLEGQMYWGVQVKQNTNHHFWDWLVVWERWIRRWTQLCHYAHKSLKIEMRGSRSTGETLMIFVNPRQALLKRIFCGALRRLLAPKP